MTTPTSPLLNPYKSLMSINKTDQSSPTVPNLNYTPINNTPPVSVPGSNEFNQSFVKSNSSNINAPQTNTPYTVKGGDTLSGIATQNNLSLKDLLALNPQYQANPNLIKPGENIITNDPSKQNFTPEPNMSPDTSQLMSKVDPRTAFADRMSPDTSQLVSPNTSPSTPNDFSQYMTKINSPVSTPPASQNNVYPSAPAVPNVTPEETTSTGETININTGGVTPAASFSGASVSSPSTPAVPNASAMTSTPGYESAVSDYSKNLELTPEEIENQQNINRLSASFRKAYTGEGDRPIPLEFITGRQQSLEQRSLDLAQPLQARASLLQAKRIASLDSSKFKLEQEQKKIDANKPISGTSFYDPTTKSFIQAPSGGADAFTLGAGQTRFDAAGNPIASNIGTGGAESTNDYKNYQLAGGEAGTKMTFAEWQGKTVPGEQSAYLIRTANQGIQSVDELLPQVSKNTTGWGAFLKGKIPESEARSFAAQIDTLKANITFGSLVAMREASKTGGALGQVSDREGQLLGAALGALDQMQSADQLRSQLNKIKSSLERWNTAVSNDGASTEEGFNW